MTAADPKAPAMPPPPPRGFTARRLLAVTVLSAGAWVLVVAACSLVGVAGVGAGGYWRLRMHRLLPASLVGAALSVAGVALQSMLRNPLAAPSILGISSGATVTAMIGMILASRGLLPASLASTTGAAAAGGVATILLVYGIAQRRGRLDPYTLLLTGVVISAFNGAIIMFLYLFASQAVFKDATVWAMGQVAEQTDPSAMIASAVVILGGWAVLLGKAKSFNLQSLGDDVASTSGVNVDWLRVLTFAVAALLTAGAVALAGPIAFVGLVVPHTARRLFGPDHRVLVVTAGFLGAAFLAAADTFCRTMVWLRTGELPLGIVTAAVGGPFFIVLLRRRFRELS